MNSFIFKCSYCDNLIEASENDCGAEAECPFCHQRIIIPEAEVRKVIITRKGNKTWTLAVVIAATVIVTAAIVSGGMIFFRSISAAKAPAVGAVVPEKPKAVVPEKTKAVVPEKPKAVVPEKPKAVVPEKTKAVVPDKTKAVVKKAKRLPVSKRKVTNVRRTYAIRNKRSEKSPKQLFQIFSSGKAATIKKLEQRMPDLPPEQQKASRELIAQIKTMAVNWQQRFDYIEKRNVKIAEAAAAQYDSELGAKVQEEFKKYTASKGDYGYNSNCIKFSKKLLEYFNDPRLDPNISLKDVYYKIHCGNALKAVSGRVVNKRALYDVLIRRFADPSCMKGVYSLSFTDTNLIKYGLPVDVVRGIFDKCFSVKQKMKADCKSIELLLYDGAAPDVNHLARAVQENRIDVVTLLLAYGIDPNGINESGETALFNSYRIIDGTAVRNLLLAAGADPDVKNDAGKKAEDMQIVGHFLRAWRNGYIDEIAEFFQKGISPDMILSDGTTLLYDACMRNDLDLVKLLFKYGVDPNYRGNVWNHPIAITYGKLWNSRNKESKEESFAIFKLMVENGAVISVNPQGWAGSNLLVHTISRFSDQDFYKRRTLELMLKHVDDFTEKHWALCSKRLSNLPEHWVIKVMNVIPENIVKKDFFFILWRPRPFPKMVSRLAQKGVDFNMVQKIHFWNREERKYVQWTGTALYLAVRLNWSPEMIRELVAHGADVNWQDRDGKKAIDFAINEQVRSLLNKR